MAGRTSGTEDREPPLSGQAPKTGKTLIKGSKRRSKDGAIFPGLAGAAENQP